MTSQINANWSLPLAIVTLMFSAFFTCAGSGATFGIAPLLQRWVTGQIAGIVGAYGSVGVLCVDPCGITLNSPGNTQFFQYLGVTSIVRTFLGRFCLRAPTIKELVGEKTAVALGY